MLADIVLNVFERLTFALINRIFFGKFSRLLVLPRFRNFTSNEPVASINVIRAGIALAAGTKLALKLKYLKSHIAVTTIHTLGLLPF